MDLNMDPLLAGPPVNENAVKIAAAANAMALDVKPQTAIMGSAAMPSPAAPTPQPGATRAKRHQIAVACSRCRSRKSKVSVILLRDEEQEADLS